MNDLYQRYLRLLGFERPPSGEAGLREIVRRQLCRAPFENVSKLLLVEREGAGRMTTLAEYLDGIEHRDLGGTCYSNNPFLCELLRELGYDADLLGADMSTPNVHTSIRVHLGAVDYHVDVGYAGPFREPIRLDGLPYEVEQGRLRYVFDRRGEDYAMDVFDGCERAHGYVVHPEARTIEFFRPVILDSFERGKTFMTCLRITRFFDGHAVELRDRRLLRFQGAQTDETELRNMVELEAAMRDEFAMPRCPVREAVRALESITGQSFW